MTTYLTPDPTRATPVRFAGTSAELAGLLYRPNGTAATDRTPAVAMCGPVSSVKEQTLPHYAVRLADAGYTVLAFDPASFGDSAGEPRARYGPSRIIDDYSAAVNHLMSRADVDAERVSLVGVCMGGGYAVSLAARDKRLRAVVSIAGGYDIGGTFLQALGVDGLADYLRLINGRVQQQYESGEVAYVPTIATELSADVPIAVMPNQEAYDYYDRTSKAEAPNWARQLTVDSLPPYFAYNAVAAAPLVAPIPLLIIHGTTDAALLPEYAQAAFDAAAEPKSLSWIETHNHVELYDQDPYVSDAAAQAVAWLDQHTGTA